MEENDCYLLLGCTRGPQGFQLAPAQVRRKSLKSAERVISGVMDGALSCLKQGPGVMPLLCAADSGQDLVAVFTPSLREYQHEVLMSGKPTLVTRDISHCPFDKNHHYMGPRKNIVKSVLPRCS